MPYKIPKQKPGFVGDWVLEESRFVDRRADSQYKNKSMIENYRNPERKEGKNKIMVNDHDRK